MAEEESTSPSEGASYRKLTPAEWEQVVVLWESGSVTLKDLQTRFGISTVSLHQGLNKRGAVKGKRAKEFARTTEEALKSDAQRRAEEIRGFKQSYQKYGDFIMQATVKELNDLLKGPRSPEVNRRIFTSLKYSAEIFATMRDQKFHLYDLYNVNDEDGQLPDIAVVQYSDEELEAIKRRFEVPLLEDDDSLLDEARAALERMETEAEG